ncbi:uncharacterized protein LOC134180781 [Corticium candelabrum]|uniref:uncharacterized protein LOC134180781 n=1 Tax=Corticium candelabrum TaxID=121492 RepID=UPI002E26B2EC|nr:uncharacterized protein LOC134180781 [Corticium candelabrum]
MKIKNLEDAERLIKKDIELRREHAVGAAGSEIANALNNLALIYEEGGKCDEAIKAYEDSIKLKRESGKLEKSLSLMEEAITISRSSYSSSHPSLAVAISFLSSTYDLLDKKDEAMKLAKQVFDIASVSLPSSHCHLASYMNGIGDCFEYRGDYNEAIVWYEKSHQLLQQLRSSPTRDEIFATTLIKLGNYFRENEKLEKSANLLEEATYDLLDEKEKALQLARKEYEISTGSLPPSHPTLQHSKAAIHLTVKMLLNHSEWDVTYNNVFDNEVFCEMLCDKLLPASYDVTDMNAMGNCYRSLGIYDEAILWHEKARKLHLKQDYSPNRDHDVARNLYLLSLDYGEKKCWTEAIKLCLHSIEMEQRRIFPNRTFIAICMMRLGSYEIKTARLEESTTHLQTALSFMQDQLPTSHYTADCHFFLATLFLAMQEAYQASLHVDKCLKIRKTVFPDCHRKIREAECLKQDIRGLKEKLVTDMIFVLFRLCVAVCLCTC